MDDNTMTQCYDLDIEHFLHLYVMIKGTPKYEEMLRLCRILDMEESAIMTITFSFVQGEAIDDESDHLTGQRMLRVEN